MAGSTKLMTAGGGGVSLTPASSIASDVTVNVPSQNCTLDIQGPAFSAYRSGGNQSVTNNTWTKVQLNTEEFDTANCFDSSTNYRFTPTVAGYYQINACVSTSSSSYTQSILCGIYKNGSSYKVGVLAMNAEIINYGGPAISAVVYLNGSTDYVELYGLNQASSLPQFSGNTSVATYMSGALVRAA